MVFLTPGVRLLAKGAAYVSVPVFGGMAIQRFMLRIYDVSMPTWAIVTASIMIIPIAGYISVFWKQVKDRRDAAAMGAQIVPKIPGKKFGNFDVVQRMTQAAEHGYPGEELPPWFDAHGPTLNMYIFYSDVFLTASPEYLKLMLATDFHNYVKGERLRHSMASVLGTGVFNSDGMKSLVLLTRTEHLDDSRGYVEVCIWFHRSITRPAFARNRISDYEIFDRHAQTVISQIKTRLNEGYAVEFQDLMCRFTLDTTTEFLFGTCVHSLSAGLPYPHNIVSTTTHGADSTATASSMAFSDAFFDALRGISTRQRYGWAWPLREISGDQTRKPMKIVDGYIQPIIKEALAKKRAEKMDEKEREGTSDHLEEGETLLDHLVQVTQDLRVIKDETDTTASTLTFVIYLLATHPAVMDRLRQEILEKVGSVKMPDQNDIKDMKYLRAVINETLRLFPVVPFNVRESVKATTWPHPDPTQKPYYIPAGTRIMYSVLLMHRSKDLWGPDADEFDPDRFLDDRLKKYLTKNSFIFLPFHAGPRICLGQQVCLLLPILPV
ncbi:hypothetical protein M378DRAFT_160099 [Amanita muscaria Koide BX008]|uniref:Cytochrome P450 n=1 Tax=Amanita muscaria (strain Koide BX008) TaxID=946122 RepID=A0A0C2SUM1_AMAMK|nr:hypothetical protein M378DRAFT_160099 [Amanita muscaria Koide BX008]